MICVCPKCKKPHHFGLATHAEKLVFVGEGCGTIIPAKEQAPAADLDSVSQYGTGKKA
jgi:hypothetical protein